MASAGTRKRLPTLVSVVGARPQFIKAAVVSQAIARLPAGRRPRHRLIHTGQHFEAGMSDVFFRDLPLPTPSHQLGLGGASPAIQLSRMLEALTHLYEREHPDVVLVYGDTTTTLAGALAASLTRIPVAHVEAGLRSFNRQMPEETNRILTDHLSQWLFCPSDTAVRHLAAEGVTEGVHVVGDVMVDALTTAQATLVRREAEILRRWGVAPKRYYLATVHRAENTVEAKPVVRLLETFAALEQPVILPLHPRTRNLLKRAAWRAPKAGSLRIVPPLPYPDMLALERSARAILTDSGGVQKEAYFWGVPCLTLRRETEWVETLQDGWNRLVGTEPNAIREGLGSLNGTLPACPPPRLWRGRRAPRPLYGDGHAGERLVRTLLDDVAPPSSAAPRRRVSASSPC